MKHFIALLCILVMTTNFIFADTLSTDEIEGEAAIVIDYRTGEVLWEKNADAQMFPASTTKIMTAIIILENHDLKESVTVSSNFISPGGSNMAIDHGETFTVQELLYGLLVKSANDAGQALAVFHSGSVEAFAEEMNKRAADLGATNTHFTNPHGMPNQKHYTTASDLAIISRHAYKNEDFKVMVNTTNYVIPPTNKKAEARTYIKTSNLFLTGVGSSNQINYKGQSINIKYDIVDGIKTGYTGDALLCLVSTASKRNERYIVVVLKSPDTDSLYIDSRTLLDYAFENFVRHQFISEGSFVETIQLKGEKGLRVNLVAQNALVKTLDKDTDLSKIKEDIVYNQNISAPLAKGQELGMITYYYDNKPLGQVSLVSEYDVSQSNLVTSIEDNLIKRTASNKIDVKYYIGIVLKLLVAFIIYRSIVTFFLLRKRKKRILEKAKQKKSVQ